MNTILNVLIVLSTLMVLSLYVMGYLHTRKLKTVRVKRSTKRKVNKK